MVLSEERKELIKEFGEFLTRYENTKMKNRRRIEIRKIIQEKGEPFLKTLKEIVIRNIAGEIMELNEDYVLNHQDEMETVKSKQILECGFSFSQRIWLIKVGDAYYPYT